MDGVVKANCRVGVDGWRGADRGTRLTKAEMDIVRPQSQINSLPPA